MDAVLHARRKSQMRTLGIDLGSSFLKAAVLDLAAGTIEHIVRQPFPEPLPGRPPGWLDYDVATVVQRCRELCAELVSRAPDVAGILITSQMGGVVLVDPHGHSVSPYYSWRDQRTVLTQTPSGATFYDAALENMGPQVFTETGREVKPGSTLLLLSWLQAHGKLPPGNWTPTNLGDAVVAGLCGTSASMEVTQAMGAINLHTGDWHAELWDRWNLTGILPSPIVSYRAVQGTCRIGDIDLPVYPAVGDHQCALYGAELAPGELSLNVSTGSQVSQVTSTVQPGNYQTRPYFDGQWLNTITHLPAGRALAVWIKLLTELATSAGLEIPDPWGAAQRAAECAPDTDLSTQLTFFSGPLGDVGHLSQIREENLSVGTLFRASLRNMAQNYAACATRLCPAQDWTQLVFSGGLIQHNVLLQQFVREQIPGSHRVCTQAEDTLWGLLKLGRSLHQQVVTSPT